MNVFGLTPEQIIKRVELGAKPAMAPTLGRSLIVGALGFCAVSLLVFATWSYGERWMYSQFGVYGAYFIWIALFMFTSGAVLSPLIIGPGRLLRFYCFFVVAFFCYGAAWTLIYLNVRGGLRPWREWLASLAGSIIWALLIALAFGAMKQLWKLMAVMFLAHSAGYFIGTAVFWGMRSETGNLLYGAIYGVGMGLGLGGCFYIAQTEVRERLGM